MTRDCITKLIDTLSHLKRWVVNPNNDRLDGLTHYLMLCHIEAQIEHFERAFENASVVHSNLEQAYENLILHHFDTSINYLKRVANDVH